jgi:predicted nucleic acid-binding Zn finger protein
MSLLQWHVDRCFCDILQVHGKSGEYLTLAKSYCSCQAHYYEVVAKSEAPYVSPMPGTQSTLAAP